MKSRPLFKNPILWLTSTGIATAIVVACSSSTSPPGGATSGCTGNDQVSCICPNGTESTAICNQPSTCACGQAPAGDDSGPAGDDDAGHNGDGGHVDDGASPNALYGLCAKPGSFGYPCTLPNAIDPTECTDPNFQYCFGGGQGYWCTASCAIIDAGDDGGDDGGEAGGGFAACLVETPDGGFVDAATTPNQGCDPSACNNKGYCK